MTSNKQKKCQLNHSEKYMFKVILFDVYGTLLDVYSIQLVLEKYFPGRGLEAARILRDKQIEYTRLYALRPKGIPYKSFMELTRSALEYTILACGKEIDEVPVIEIISRYQNLNVFPEVQGLLDSQELKSYKTAVLSNGNSGMLKEVLKNVGLDHKFDGYLCASSVSSFKIDSEVYQMASQFFKCSLSECLLVSANYWDIIGANWSGLKTFWLSRSSVPRDLIGNNPDFEGKSLNDLKHIL